MENRKTTKIVKDIILRLFNENFTQFIEIVKKITLIFGI